MHNRRAARFAIAAVVSFGLTCAAIVGSFHVLLDRRDPLVPVDYQEFLLQAIPSPRIVVDSGSNGVYSIDGRMMEAHFRRNVVVASDNAGIPFSARLHRLRARLRPGDILIMPLEWPYYVKEGWAEGDFMIGVFGGWNKYFAYESFWQRLRREAFEIGIRDAWRGLRKSDRDLWRELVAPFSMRPAVVDQLRRLNANHPNGDYVGLFKRLPRETDGTCRGYIGFSPDAVAPNLPRIVAALAQLEKATGSRVIMTWPAVAGDDCYGPDPGGSALVASIRAAFARVGIAVVGDPAQSEFPDSAVLNTYYHVKPWAARIRTQRLIDVLDAAGLIPKATGPFVPTKEIAARTLAAIEDRLERLQVERLRRIEPGRFRVTSTDFERYFALGSGWAQIEDWGVWSDDTTSQIVLKPRRAACRLRFESTLFRGPESLVSIDGSPFRIEDGAWLDIPPGGGLVRITFRHRDLVSPADLGGSLDPRKIKYGLKAIEVDCAPRPSREPAHEAARSRRSAPD
jgi:hypothetical protein